MSLATSDHLIFLRKKVPLVHQITNYVTVNDCANITLCTGGSPVMTDAIEDVEDMVGLASALVLNIGTLNERTVESMIIAGKAANKKKIPVILDPVGVGATKYRTEVALRILKEVKVSIIKGNGGEIGVLSGLGGEVRGVDSVSTSDEPAILVKELAKQTGCVVAMSGEKDYVSDGEQVAEISNGTDFMGKVSGTGCMLSSAMGCFAGTTKDMFAAAVNAMVVFSVAGEFATNHASGPGTFKAAFMDAMYNLDAKVVDAKANIKEL